ncbi:MAG: hypothetical protein AAF564_21695 [Bacteroidota bacterium]
MKLPKSNTSLYPLVPVLYAVVILLTAAGCNKASLGESYPEPFYGQLLAGDSLITPVAQVVSDRVFEDSAYVVVKQFIVHPEAATEDTPAERISPAPVAAVVDAAEDYLYLFDKETFTLRKFSIADGTLQFAIEIDVEQKRNGRPVLRLVSDEVLWIANIEKGKIVRYTSAGERLSDLDMPGLGTPIVADDGAFVIANYEDNEGLFHSYSPRMKKQDAFGVLTNIKVALQGIPYPGHGMGFMGEGVTDGSHSFVYAGLLGGGLLSYKMDGSLRYFRESIDHSNFPGVREDTTRQVTVLSTDMEGVETQQIPFNVWNDTYYQFYSVIGEEDWGWDAYDYNSGDYKYSIRRSNQCGNNFITDTHVYANCLNRGFFQMKRAEAVNSSKQALAAIN